MYTHIYVFVQRRRRWVVITSRLFSPFIFLLFFQFFLIFLFFFLFLCVFLSSPSLHHRRRTLAVCSNVVLSPPGLPITSEPFAKEQCLIDCPLSRWVLYCANTLCDRLGRGPLYCFRLIPKSRQFDLPGAYGGGGWSLSYIHTHTQPAGCAQARGMRISSLVFPTA